MLHHFRTLQLNISYENIFKECSKDAEKRGYDYFGVQYYSECWGSKDAYATYDKHGCTNNCKVNQDYGIGTYWSNFIYHLKNGKVDTGTVFSNNCF
jgi:hypothetical protein